MRTAGSSSEMRRKTLLPQRPAPAPRSQLPRKESMMRLLLAASAASLFLSVPAFAQSASPSDKSKSLDALHSEALIEAAKTGYADAPVEEKAVATRHSA